ncbi:MAG: hypothetical protein KTR26_05290 [Flammeovirgaceae bacterium]|nr:hypothetical protein [Flammeovirgaceae bacterium]
MENTVAQKLAALEKLQNIDSKIDEIKKIRGDLPEEVQDLEDEIAGYETRIQKIKNEIDQLDDNIKSHKAGIKESDKLVEKYEAQQMDVRNNREYDAITKEMELQDLEKQILNKKIKETKEIIDGKKGLVEETKVKLAEREKDLTNKKGELDNIVAETELEEKKLTQDRDKAMSNIEDRLVNSYVKIRKNAKNGLAVVHVQRGACGGCFNMVPPQRQADIKEKKKIIVCEHCGRIFSDVELVIEVEKPKRAGRKKAASKTTKAKAK